MASLSSEHQHYFRLPTSITDTIASATTSASFSTTLQSMTLASGFNLSESTELVVRPSTSESNIRAGTSGDYEESRTPQQETSQDRGIYASNAATITYLPSTSQPPSSTIYTHSDPLSGLSWSFEAPPLPVSSGQLIFFYKIPKFTTAVTLLFICRFSNQSFL